MKEISIGGMEYVTPIFKLLTMVDWKNLLNRLAPCKKIVVYGESGVGKTAFLHAILGKENVPSDKTEDICRYKWNLPDGHRIELIDTPGHKTLSYIREKLYREFCKGQIWGVINIVAYGYMNDSNANEQGRIFDSENHVKLQFLEENRERELMQIDEWRRNIHADNKVKWFITLVNKADIWYKDWHTGVENWYRSGEYNRRIEGFQHCCKTLVYPYCSTIAPFMGRPMSLEMSEREKKEMHNKFIEELMNLISQCQK